MAFWRRLAAIVVVASSAALAPLPAAAQGDGMAIAAIVNDDVISIYDLESRVNLAIVSASVPNNPEVRQRLRPQVLRQLIDEKLQLQEAKRLNLEVTDRERQTAVANVERQNNMGAGGLAAFLRQRGLPFQPLSDQISASIAWQKVVRRLVQSQVEVGEEEVTEHLNQLRARGGLTEYAASEIFLPVNRMDEDESVRQTAERLIEQIRGGAMFPAVARQFSQSATAAVGGDLGVVIQGTLDPRLERALEALNPREISTPIRTDAGYYILALRDKRTVAGPRPDDTVIGLRRLVLNTPPNASEDVLRSQAELARSLSQNATGCDDMARLARELKTPVETELGKLRLGDLPGELRTAVGQLAIGKASPPIRAPDGFIVLMVCSREEATSGLPSREAVADTLRDQRIESLQRRLLRDLRRAAYIDVRV